MCIRDRGSLGDQVNVKAGYARHFLVPQAKAVPATKKNIEFFEARRTELEAKLAEVLAAANARAEKINEMCIRDSASTASIWRIANGSRTNGVVRRFGCSFFTPAMRCIW